MKSWPRPADARIPLDGIWEFVHLGSDSSRSGQVRSIRVPGPWQSQFRDMAMRAGIGIYRREVHVPRGWMRDRIFLRFGAVFHQALVRINGTPVGGNEGGFLPFGFDVTAALRADNNEIEVRVESPTDDPNAFPHAPFAEIPFGKQSWYGPLSASGSRFTWNVV